MTSAVKGRSADFGPEDYDAIERAVMETPRGRWFLAERDKRLRTVETQRILDALKKLEGVLAAVPPPTAPVNGTEVLKAIAVQRAIQERHAPVDATKQPASIAIAELTSASAETVAQTLSMKNMKYFKQDEAIFTPAEPAAPKLAVVETETPAQKPKAMLSPKPEDAVAKGARLIVNRIAPADAQPAAVATVPETPSVPADHASAVESPPATAAAESVDKRRIVIIRRTAAELMEVPLQADLSASLST